MDDQPEMTIARLALEDGSLWRGRAFGKPGTQTGEVVFNTSLTGYQEILTDPSYAGQIVVMTAPQIGNTGINPEDHESRRAFLRGFVIHDLSPTVSNWRATCSLDEWLAEQNLMGISDIDTRALTCRLREKGSMKGIITADNNLSDADLIVQAQSWAGLDGIDLVQEVTCPEPYRWVEANDPQWHSPMQIGNRPFQVVAYDYGIKHSILRRLAAYGCLTTIVPATTTADEVLAMKPDGVLLSNGPGDPAAVTYAIEATQSLLGKVPLFGICLGHQIMGLAYGGTTYRLKFGHHGGNQPVKHMPTGSVQISAHNHNFAVDPASLPEDVEVTHINLNDQCNEGMRHRRLPAISIQYHPEAAPGPHDAVPIFDEFVQMMVQFNK
jgi:carbamoyl-phosphate synthase small subunit